MARSWKVANLHLCSHRSQPRRIPVYVCSNCRKQLPALTELCPHCQARLKWTCKACGFSGGPASDFCHSPVPGLPPVCPKCFSIQDDPISRRACPDCLTPLPAFRKPKSLHQALWGGWTCATCGLEIDAWKRSQEATAQVATRACSRCGKTVRAEALQGLGWQLADAECRALLDRAGSDGEMRPTGRGGRRAALRGAECVRPPCAWGPALLSNSTAVWKHPLTNRPLCLQCKLRRVS